MLSRNLIINTNIKYFGVLQFICNISYYLYKENNGVTNLYIKLQKNKLSKNIFCRQLQDFRKSSKINSYS